MDLDELLQALRELLPPNLRTGSPVEANFQCERCVACRECRFCTDCEACRSCTYCDSCRECENCTQCRRCDKCSQSSYLEDSRLCSESSYLLLCVDCTRCVHCLACVGLDDAEFCILNRKVARKENLAIVRELKAELLARIDSGEAVALPWLEDSSAEIGRSIRPRGQTGMLPASRTVQTSPVTTRNIASRTSSIEIPSRERSSTGLHARERSTTGLHARERNIPPPAPIERPAARNSEREGSRYAERTTPPPRDHGRSSPSADRMARDRDRDDAYERRSRLEPQDERPRSSSLRHPARAWPEAEPREQAPSRSSPRYDESPRGSRAPAPAPSAASPRPNNVRDSRPPVHEWSERRERPASTSAYLRAPHDEHEPRERSASTWVRASRASERTEGAEDRSYASPRERLTMRHPASDDARAASDSVVDPRWSAGPSKRGHENPARDDARAAKAVWHDDERDTSVEQNVAQSWEDIDLDDDEPSGLLGHLAPPPRRARYEAGYEAGHDADHKTGGETPLSTRSADHGVPTSRERASLVRALLPSRARRDERP